MCSSIEHTSETAKNVVYRHGQVCKWWIDGDGTTVPIFLQCWRDKCTSDRSLRLEESVDFIWWLDSEEMNVPTVL